MDIETTLRDPSITDEDAVAVALTILRERGSPSQVGTPPLCARVRLLNAQCVPLSAVGREGRLVGRSVGGLHRVWMDGADDVYLLERTEFEVLPDTESTGEPVPPRADLPVTPEEATDPPSVASSGPLEHVAFLRAQHRVTELEALCAKLATDLQGMGAALDATLAGSNVEGAVLVVGERLAALVDAATAVLADPTPDALTALRRALAQKVRA